ncbi:MAG TPA: hypothetical protein VLZ07_00115 [Syntrophales bacterium]|nr:hypothetical protein [Syntrophales bacterium]
MLKVLDDESAIRKYRRQFTRSFKPFIDEKITINLGHPGGTVKAKVAWSDRLGIWMFQEKISESRYWHAFGTGRPSASSHIPITCEINFPAKGIDRRIGGALAEDSRGRIFVVHRGRIGGGKKGVGKTQFEDHYRGAWATMEDGGLETTVALIGVLDSPRFVRQVTQFVRKVERIKDIISQKSPQLEMAFDELRFREELVGVAYHRIEHDLRMKCDYDLIVTDLHKALVKSGMKVGNNLTRDLFVVNAKGRVASVFEVLTDVSTDGLNSGIAKLLLNNVDLTERPSLVLVIPETIDQLLEMKLKKLGIDVLVYEWKHDHAVFSI